MPDSHITDPHTQKQCSLDRHEDKLRIYVIIFLMKLNKHKLIYIWPQLKYLQIHS